MSSASEDDLIARTEDFDVLNEQEEEEKLLRQQQQHSRRAANEESFDLERGSGRPYSSPARPRRRRLSWLQALKMSVIGMFLASMLYFLLATAKASSKTGSGARLLKTVLSNGTHDYHPTTILISLDGYRPDYLLQNVTPTLDALATNGQHPDYMWPSFPSVTFPNHYTIVTGLYPNWHGIVGNSFYDPDLDDTFFYQDPAHSLQTKWWGGEAIWRTAELAGLVSAVHMWPGSEVPHLEPTYVDAFNQTETLALKTRQILDWLDLEISSRPQFVAAYVPDIDTAGHEWGPDTPEMIDSLGQVDMMLNDIVSGIVSRNLSGVVNLVIVSDHGMAATSKDRLVFLDDIIDMDEIERVDGWPLYGLRPKSTVEVGKLESTLRQGLQDYPVDVYMHDTFPSRYHFGGNDRIAPLWLVPKAGWAIVTHDEYDNSSGMDYEPRGLHGYDNLDPSMHALFVANGPAFPAKKLEPFYNIEVYDVLCKLLQIKPAPNNGTLNGTLLPQTSTTSSTPSATADATPVDPGEYSIQTSDPYATPENTEEGENADAETTAGAEMEDLEAELEYLSWMEYMKWKMGAMKDGMTDWWDGLWEWDVVDGDDYY